MSATNDGGPAFPHNEATSTGEPYYDHLGMTLRDWFAGQALAGLLTGDKPSASAACHLVASWAYEQADAMLAAKEARK